MLPDELPPQLAQQLQAMVAAGAGGEAAMLVQGAMRPGCVHMAVDVLVTISGADIVEDFRVGGAVVSGIDEGDEEGAFSSDGQEEAPPADGGDREGEGEGTSDDSVSESGSAIWCVSSRAQAEGEARLKRLLPAGELVSLLVGAAGAAGAAAASAGGAAAAAREEGRLCHAQVGARWVTAPRAGRAAWERASRVAGGAPRLVVGLPCALAVPSGAESDEADGGGNAEGVPDAASRLVVVATGVDADCPGLFVRSRGFYHPTPPPVPVWPRAAAGGGSTPPAGAGKQCFLVSLPALAPGLVLVEAEKLPHAPRGGPVFSNQVPVVACADSRVVAELRQLEWALLGGGARDARGGVCRCGAAANGLPRAVSDCIEAACSPPQRACGRMQAARGGGSSCRCLATLTPALPAPCPLPPQAP
jgi:hypothetical protein